MLGFYWCFCRALNLPSLRDSTPAGLVNIKMTGDFLLPGVTCPILLFWQFYAQVLSAFIFHSKLTRKQNSTNSMLYLLSYLLPHPHLRVFQLASNSQEAQDIFFLCLSFSLFSFPPLLSSPLLFSFYGGATDCPQGFMHIGLHHSLLFTFYSETGFHLSYLAGLELPP